jgi:hypothetical protein
MIKYSAIKINGRIFKGISHEEIIYDLVVNKKASLPLDGEQGFIDEKGKFLSREDAATHALACGQIEKLKFCTSRLFSEDLAYRPSSYLLKKAKPHAHIA